LPAQSTIAVKQGLFVSLINQILELRRAVARTMMYVQWTNW